MRAVFAMGTLALALVLAAPISAEVPDVIAAGKVDRSEPQWRSAAVLEDEQGIRWDLFNAYETEELHSRLGVRQPVEGQTAGAVQQGEPACLVYGPTITEATTFHSLEESIGRSAAIYTGTVLGYKEGFLYRHPGSLYEVAVHENLMPGRTPARVFVYYPASDFPLGDHLICKRGRRYPERPRVGGEILVFAFNPAPALGETVVLPTDSGLFFEAEDGGLSVPSKLRSLEGIRELPVSDVVEQVREVVGEIELEPKSPDSRRLLERDQGGRP